MTADMAMSAQTRIPPRWVSHLQ